MEAAVECIPTKPRANCIVLWKKLAIRKKRDDMKTAYSCDKRNKQTPTFGNSRRHKEN